MGRNDRVKSRVKSHKILPGGKSFAIVLGTYTYRFAVGLQLMGRQTVYSQASQAIDRISEILRLSLPLNL